MQVSTQARRRRRRVMVGGRRRASGAQRQQGRLHRPHGLPEPVQAACVRAGGTQERASGRGCRRRPHRRSPPAHTCAAAGVCAGPAADAGCLLGELLGRLASDRAEGDVGVCGRPCGQQLGGQGRPQGAIGAAGGAVQAPAIAGVAHQDFSLAETAPAPKFTPPRPISGHPESSGSTQTPTSPACSRPTGPAMSAPPEHILDTRPRFMLVSDLDWTMVGAGGAADSRAGRAAAAPPPHR